MFTIMQSTDILWNHLKIYKNVEEQIESDSLTTSTRVCLYQWTLITVKIVIYGCKSDYKP